MKSCIAFEMDDPQAAYEHIKPEVLINYGDEAYGKCLHMRDDGSRVLVRCKVCGGMILIQESEFHSFTDSSDSLYIDYFPVISAEEADSINRKWGGYELERLFQKRYLCVTNGRPHWSTINISDN